MRVWIEIIPTFALSGSRLFHPLMRVWIEIEVGADFRAGYEVSPSYEGVD